MNYDEQIKYIQRRIDIIKETTDGCYRHRDLIERLEKIKESIEEKKDE